LLGKEARGFLLFKIALLRAALEVRLISCAFFKRDKAYVVGLRSRHNKAEKPGLLPTVSGAIR